jgi:hypothetical protein
MMLFLYNQQPVQGVASSCKIPSALWLMASSNSCIPFTAMLILAAEEPLLYILHVKYRSCVWNK